MKSQVYEAKAQNLAYLRGHICSVVNIMPDIYSAWWFVGWYLLVEITFWCGGGHA